MTSYLLAGPAEEPLSLAEAKAFLRVDDTAEDGLIATLIAAARLHVEGSTARATIAQAWRVVLDEWPLDGEVRLPVGPVLSLTSITVLDDDGEPHELDSDQFTVGGGDMLFVPAEVDGMPALRQRLGIEIDYVAGFGTEPADVPSDLRQAMLALVAYWHANRDAVIVAGSGAVVPAGFDRLISNYRRVRL
jgi:uncharacterized phiE125 gp8 family phage protein